MYPDPVWSWSGFFLLNKVCIRIRSSVLQEVFRYSNFGNSTFVYRMLNIVDLGLYSSDLDPSLIWAPGSLLVIQALWYNYDPNPHNNTFGFFIRSDPKSDCFFLTSDLNSVGTSEYGSILLVRLYFIYFDIQKKEMQ